MKRKRIVRMAELTLETDETAVTRESDRRAASHSSTSAFKGRNELEAQDSVRSSDGPFDGRIRRNLGATQD